MRCARIERILIKTGPLKNKKKKKKKKKEKKKKRNDIIKRSFGHSRSLIRIFAGRTFGALRMRDFFMRAAKTDHSTHAQADLSRRWAHIYKKVRFLTLRLKY